MNLKDPAAMDLFEKQLEKKSIRNRSRLLITDDSLGTMTHILYSDYDESSGVKDALHESQEQISFDGAFHSQFQSQNQDLMGNTLHAQVSHN
jgi:hypothetical protein